MVGCQPKGGERREQLARRVSGFWARVQACLHDAGAPLATLHLIGYAYTSCGRWGVCCPAIVVLAVPLDCLFGTAGNLGSEENYHSAKPKEGHLVLIGTSFFLRMIAASASRRAFQLIPPLSTPFELSSTRERERPDGFTTNQVRDGSWQS